MNSHQTVSTTTFEQWPIGDLSKDKYVSLLDGRHRDVTISRQDQPALRAITLHIIDTNSVSRAKMARLAFMSGHHAEIYADCNEIIDCTPNSGVILFAVEPGEPLLNELMTKLAAQGTWLPVIGYSATPDARTVVDTIRMGAIDYIAMPLDLTQLHQSIERVLTESKSMRQLRTLEAEAVSLLSRLSKREREVLGAMSRGKSNKEIARDLEISPRTVEIHRMKMMAKLGARHSADAVRMQFLAEGPGAMAA